MAPLSWNFFTVSLVVEDVFLISFAIFLILSATCSGFIFSFDLPRMIGLEHFAYL